MRKIGFLRFAGGYDKTSILSSRAGSDGLLDRDGKNISNTFRMPAREAEHTERESSYARSRAKGRELMKDLKDKGVSSHTIDMDSLFGTDITSTGSFDVQGGVWASTFGKLLRALPIPALLVSESYRIAVANSACAKINSEYEQTIDRPFGEIFSGASAAQEALALVEEVFRTRDPQVKELFLGNENKVSWARATMRSIRIAEHRFVLVLLEDLTPEKEQIILQQKHNERLQREIAQRGETEKELRESRRRFRELAELLPQFVFELDVEGKFIFSNRFAMEATGFTRQDFEEGLNIFRLFIPSDQERLAEDVAKVLGGETLSGNEYTCLRKDATTFPMVVYSSPIHYRNGIVGLRGVGVDITRLRQAESGLRESEQRFRDLGELLPQYVFEVDGHGKFTFLNKAGLESGGYTQEDLDRGLYALEVFIPEDIEAVARDIERVLTGENVGGHEYTVKKKDGSTFPSLTYSVPIIRDGEVVGLRGIGIDVTEQKAAQDRMKADIKEKELLLREIHHRVKNNLQVMSSMMQLQLHYDSDKSVKEVLGALDDRVRAMALVHGHLYSTTKLETIDVNGYVNSVLSPLTDTYSARLAGVTCTTQVEDISWGIDTAVPFGLILNELVTNCLKHAFPEGRSGEIRVTVRAVGEKEFELLVSDNGVGIPDHVDFPNVTTFGLDLVVMLTQQLKGSVQMTRSGGTEFRIGFREAAGYEKNRSKERFTN